jgi:2-dehydro-3-deoxygluconokinase
MIGSIGEGLFELGLDEGASDAPLRSGYGGDAANTAVMAALAGAESRFGGRVGDDALGRLLLDFWTRSGVDTRWVVVDPDAPTGLYVNERLSEGGTRFHYHRRGSAGSRLEAVDLPDAFVDGLEVLHLTGVTLSISRSAADAALEAAERARRRGAAVSFALNHRPALRPDAAELADTARAATIVFVAADEAGQVLGIERPDDVARALGVGPREVVVTLGADGALVRAEGAVTRVQAPTVDVVDAGGAGDALAGAYLAARLEGRTPAAALARAVLAASLSCSAYGCALSYPDRAGVDSATAEARYP